MRSDRAGVTRISSRTFHRARVTVLLAVLAGVSIFAWRDFRTRRARNDWDHTLHVALVLLRTTPVDDRAFEWIRSRTRALEDHMEEEARRHMPSAARPFRFDAFGPVDVDAPPPAPEGDGILDLARLAYRSRRYFAQVDALGGVDPDAFDTRLYVVVRASPVADRTRVEGRSEQGGRTGSAEVEMSDADSADFALIVVAHELFHTLGAEDKYDARGRALVPDGLAEPDRLPVYPQRFTEIMARNRPVDADHELPPDRIEDVVVGPATAREIGWSRPHAHP